ncbi:sugar lactone lactonase YvrE [Bradyrhizobium sp. i1.4.4]
MPHRIMLNSRPLSVLRTTGRRIIREHAGHRREIADIAVDDAEQRSNGGLIGRDAVDGVIAVAARKAQPGREAGEPVAAGAGT